jgi:hypothetical protein
MEIMLIIAFQLGNDWIIIKWTHANNAIAIMRIWIVWDSCQSRNNWINLAWSKWTLLFLST